MRPTTTGAATTPMAANASCPKIGLTPASRGSSTTARSEPPAATAPEPERPPRDRSGCTTTRSRLSPCQCSKRSGAATMPGLSSESEAPGRSHRWGCTSLPVKGSAVGTGCQSEPATSTPPSVQTYAAPEAGAELTAASATAERSMATLMATDWLAVPLGPASPTKCRARTHSSAPSCSPCGPTRRYSGPSQPTLAASPCAAASVRPDVFRPKQAIGSLPLQAAAGRE
mmetsp:Transcript_128250/g.356979  ORF Transcript_128250/g.356979 Transcript_128250/m.356979 type:complete len:228 (-) Transcript_128250:487-1170(-)